MTDIKGYPLERRSVGEGWRLHSHVLGDGPDLVLLHGLPQDPLDFVGLAASLRSDFRCHLLELPGYAESTPLAPPPAIAESRSRIARYVREQCTRAPWVLGFSGGSYRALDLALDGGVELAGLILMAPVAAVSETMSAGLMGGADAIAAGVDLAPGLVPGWFSEAYLATHGEEALAIARAALASGAPESIAADARAFAALPDLRPRLGALGLPVAVVVGERDATTPVADARAIAASSGARLEIIEGSGHFVHHEEPTALEGALRSILGG